MKKFFMMAVMAVCALAANAQTPAAGSITVTPKVGINIATMTGEGDDDVKSKIGLAIGAEGLYMIDDMFGVSAGVIYSQQGCKMDLPMAELGKVDATYSADYVNIPVLANAYLAPGFAVKLGVQPAFLVNEKMKTEATVLGEKYSESNNPEALNSFELSIPIGCSYEYKNIMLDARYNWNVTNIAKEDDDKSHNSVFQITLGYRF